MARINLLPWRDERRERRRRHFVLILVAAVALALAAVLAGDRIIGRAIDRQLARNNHVGAQISLLDQRIAKIGELKLHREQLVERMKIIQDLQGNRSTSARVFDQLARTLPDGVYFTEVRMSGKTLSITGAAESNRRVSELMRNLDASYWFDAPSLTEVKAAAADSADQRNLFQLTVHQTRPAMDEDGL
ncbi:PilN domain-containing protein [Pseudomonas chlororaphis]|uniref:Pilus assembly protein PilN n=1 Tax=Pseudomonas chlororaphis TaxID=587753 RepID=A0A1Q8EXY7_9PSED|nr:PilN domain-containing protein [Pseudomonas chlororaphis]OLF56673.1 pilus assembly protein PilN [Pseudomonas chlororaphis]